MRIGVELRKLSPAAKFDSLKYLSNLQFLYIY